MSRLLGLCALVGFVLVGCQTESVPEETPDVAQETSQPENDPGFVATPSSGAHSVVTSPGAAGGGGGMGVGSAAMDQARRTAGRAGAGSAGQVPSESGD